MHVAGCRREIVNYNALRSWQLPAIRHHVLRRRTAADEDANNQNAQSPNRDGTSLQCFEETTSHKKIPPLRSAHQWPDAQAAEVHREPRQNTFNLYRSAARLFRACAFSDSVLELLTHLVARGVEFFPLLQ